jgi:putative hemin transport protein
MNPITPPDALPTFRAFDRLGCRTPPERWLVQLGSDEMRAMTLSELDEAYRRGSVDDRTLVLPDGSRQWTTLGELDAPRSSRRTVEVREAWLDAQAKGRELHEIARDAGMTEAELVASACGSPRAVTAFRLEGPRGDLFELLPSVGRISASTRNELASLEAIGSYESVESCGPIGQALGELDLSFDRGQWRHAFLLRERTARGVRRSVRFFDRSGTSVHTLVPVNPRHFDCALRDFLSNDTSPDLDIEPLPQHPVERRADADVDVRALRDSWLGVRGSLDFSALLARFGITRLQALRLAGSDFAFQIRVDTIESVLDRCVELGLPITMLVSNRGARQVCTGPLRFVRKLGAWLVAMGSTFTFRVGDGLVDTAWIVRRPSWEGTFFCLELYSAAGEPIAVIGGAPEHASRVAWMALVCARTVRAE